MHARAVVEPVVHHELDPRCSGKVNDGGRLHFLAPGHQNITDFPGVRGQQDVVLGFGVGELGVQVTTETGEGGTSAGFSRMLQVPSSVRAVLLRSSQVISAFRRSQFSRSNMLLLSSSVRSALSVSSPPTMPMVPNLVSAGQVTHGVILMIPLLASVYCVCWSRDQGRGPGKKLPPTGGGGGGGFSGAFPEM